MNKIDARGLACPAPVIQTKAELENELTDIIEVIVDNEAARQNICRFLESRNFSTSVTRDGNDFRVIGKKIAGDLPEKQETKAVKSQHGRLMVMVATDRMGHGDDELGAKLMVSFLKTLMEMGQELWRLIFVNNGVKLTVTDSEVLSILQELENSGIDILVCGTCLNHFNLLEKKQVGETTNMLDIVTSMQIADKVINI